VASRRCVHGYTVGFVITILGLQDLFPLLVRRDRATLVTVLRFWAVVLVANLVGTALFAVLLSRPGLFPPAVQTTLGALAKTSVDGVFLVTLQRAVLAGWLIALMAWMLPSARSARFFVILLLTYVAALCSLPHVVAGSVESAYAVLTGTASIAQYFGDFLLPTLIGNTVGDVALVAMLNHALLAEELKPDRAERSGPPEQ
jgi:formate/nitrite transporter FocA (FNT family)